MERAVIYAFTEIHSAAAEFQDRAPYFTGILEGPDGRRFPAFLLQDKAGGVRVGGEAVYVCTDDNGVPTYRADGAP